VARKEKRAIIKVRGVRTIPGTYKGRGDRVINREKQKEEGGCEPFRRKGGTLRS